MTQSTSLYGKMCDLRSTRRSATPRFPNSASTQKGIILFFPLLSSRGSHCLSEEVAVWRQNNLRLLYIIGVTGRVLFTQPETRTLRKTAGRRICLLFFLFSQFKLFLFHFCETSTDFWREAPSASAAHSVCLWGRRDVEHEGKSLWLWREMTSWQKSSHDFVPSAAVAEKWDARTQIVLLWKQNVTGWESQ